MEPILPSAPLVGCPVAWPLPLGAPSRPPEPLGAHRGGAAAELGALYKAALRPRAMAPRRLRSHGPKDTQAVLHPPLWSPGSRAGSSAAWRLQACNSSAGPRLVGVRAGVRVRVWVGVRAGVGLGVGLRIRVGVRVRVRVRVGVRLRVQVRVRVRVRARIRVASTINSRVRFSDLDSIPRFTWLGLGFGLGFGLG